MNFRSLGNCLHVLQINSIFHYNVANVFSFAGLKSELRRSKHQDCLWTRGHGTVEQTSEASSARVWRGSLCMFSVDPSTGHQQKRYLGTSQP